MTLPARTAPAARSVLPALSPLMELRAALEARTATPVSVAAKALAQANGSASGNTYLWLEPKALLQAAAGLERQRAAILPSLWSVPVSLKDCFDLEGAPTSCGTHFYAGRGAAECDSGVARRLREAGALVVGKTHLHPLAYGITGQNPDFGDCVQPREPGLLTGGSSGGAAGSVQEGSALAAIGTDTGGSIRVPAVLCGLVGYRASHGLAERHWPEMWEGAAHLAPSFDTLGFLLRDPRDVAPFAEGFLRIEARALHGTRLGCIAEAWLGDAEPEVLQGYRLWRRVLSPLMAEMAEMDASAWPETLAIFGGIQAHEAAKIHAGNYERFEGAIGDRLRWGATFNEEAIASLHRQLEAFCAAVGVLFRRFDLLMMPCAPVTRLRVDEDLGGARARILRYTTPFSLAGLPVLTLPGELVGAPFGSGVQIAAAPGADALLLGLADAVGLELAQARSEPDATLLLRRTTIADETTLPDHGSRSRC